MPYLEQQNSKIYYKIIGEGEPVIFIAGLAANHRNWGMQFGSLKKYYKLIAVDNRGIGKSVGEICRLNIEDMVEDINMLVDSMKLENPHIIGHSMGAMIAFEFVKKYPHKVSSLILASLPINKTKVIREDPSKELYSLIDGKDNNFNNKMVSYLFSNHFMHTEKYEVLKSMFSYSHNDYKRDVIEAQLNAINEWKQLRRWEIGMENVPYMVVYGSEDKFASIDHSYLSKIFPSASIKVFKNSGHAVHIEKAKEFNMIVRQFIKEKTDS